MKNINQELEYRPNESSLAYNIIGIGSRTSGKSDRLTDPFAGRIKCEQIGVSRFDWRWWIQVAACTQLQTIRFAGCCWKGNAHSRRFFGGSRCAARQRVTIWNNGQTKYYVPARSWECNACGNRPDRWMNDRRQENTRSGSSEVELAAHHVLIDVTSSY